MRIALQSGKNPQNWLRTLGCRVKAKNEAHKVWVMPWGFESEVTRLKIHQVHALVGGNKHLKTFFG
ncbi:hypothetical protein ABTF02_18425, partial [Acinetobacter baumannii]